jgi:hypothetical protein
MFNYIANANYNYQYDTLFIIYNIDELKNYDVLLY